MRPWVFLHIPRLVLNWAYGMSANPRERPFQGWGSSGRRFKSCQPDARKPALTSSERVLCIWGGAAACRPETTTTGSVFTTDQVDVAPRQFNRPKCRITADWTDMAPKVGTPRPREPGTATIRGQR